MNKRYDVLFKGRLRPGVNLSEVEKRLSILLKIEARKLDKFLSSGSSVVIKSNVSYEEAEKTKTVVNKTGAECEIVPTKQHEDAKTVKKHTVYKGSEESRLVLSIIIISLIMVVFFSLLSMLLCFSFLTLFQNNLRLKPFPLLFMQHCLSEQLI